MKRSNTQILASIKQLTLIANDTKLPQRIRDIAKRRLTHNENVIAKRCIENDKLRQTRCFQSGGNVIYKSRKFVNRQYDDVTGKPIAETITFKKVYVEVFESHLPKYHCANCQTFETSRKVCKAMTIEIEKGNTPFCRNCKIGKVTNSQGFRKVIERD